MIVYNYDKDTKEYVGSCQAYEDPLESEKQGFPVYLIPAYCTEKEVPKYGKNQIPVFNGTDWEIVSDFRNAKVYNSVTRKEENWTALGALPNEYTITLEKSLNEELGKALMAIKVAHRKCLTTLIHIDFVDLDFTYNSLSSINNEITNNISVSRDANNKIYSLTKAQLEEIRDFLTIYGQLAYIYKWELEKKVNSCVDLLSLEAYTSNIKIEVNLDLVKDLLALTATKRKNYLVRLADSLK